MIDARWWIDVKWPGGVWGRDPYSLRLSDHIGDGTTESILTRRSTTVRFSDWWAMIAQLGIQ
jgi:hypothetical protein